MMNTLRNILMVVVVVVFVGVGSVKGATIVDDPEYLVDTSDGQSIRMAYGDNLMERIDGVDSVVDKGDGEYYIFFGKEVAGGMEFGAYLETDNYESNNTAGYEGWCFGRINRVLFLEGYSPDFVLAFYDDDGGQWALDNVWIPELNDGDGGFAFVFDSNLVFWETGDYFSNIFPDIDIGEIEYDGVIGGFSDFVFDDGNGTMIIGHTVLVPEPVTLALLAVGGIAALVRCRRRRV